MLHNELKHKKQTVPSAQKKKPLKSPDLSLEWKEICSLLFTVTHDTTIREFQYKLLNNIVLQMIYLLFHWDATKSFLAAAFSLDF